MRGARRLATAVLVGAVAALVADVLLQAALSVVRVGGGYPWLMPVLIARGRWVILGALLWWIAPRLDAASTDAAADPLPPLPWSSAFWTAGVAMLVVPVLWLVATVLVRALMITLGGDWSIDGRVFVSSYFYSNLLIDYAPWAMAGATALALARHVPAPSP